MVDLTKRNHAGHPATRFCTSELKTIPMIDYILDEVNDDVPIIQGIRARECQACRNVQAMYVLQYYVAIR